MTDTTTETPDAASTKRAAFKFNYICRSKCKKLALQIAKEQRAQKFTRVSEDFLIAAEACLKTFIYDRVKRHPSVGKTLM